MILTFAYPSSPDRTGGVIVLYELANACARRGHEVHFVHGPLTPYRVGSLDELPPFPFDARIAHHLVDTVGRPADPGRRRGIRRDGAPAAGPAGRLGAGVPDAG